MDEASRTYAVCDGMGGHQAGEVASMTASETIRIVFERFAQKVRSDPSLSFEGELPPSGDLLVRAIRLANRNIHKMAESDAARAGMGTTIVAVTFEGDIMTVAHVGDSRAYLLQKTSLKPLTKDHSWASEMQQAQAMSGDEANSLVGKNIITRALGVRPGVEVDYRLVKLEPDDIFILCSDGLCGFSDDDEIHRVAVNADGDVKRIVNRLVQLAIDRGAPDNVTVLAVQVAAVDTSVFENTEAQTVPAESAQTLAAEDDWVQRIRSVQDQFEREEAKSTRRSGGGKMPLLLIFLSFVIVAVVIVYLSSHT
jgi:serine/threonine protein phosphatase PrpC